MNCELNVTRYVTVFIIFTILMLATVPVHAEDMLLSSVQADFILVEKAERRLTLYLGDRVLRTYDIALGKNPEGPKVRQGDGRTPEGLYYIDSRNLESNYHLALHISYPDGIDIEMAERRGVSPGGNIMIHGAGEKHDWMGKFHTAVDWTEGCIAVTNDEIEEIWQLVPDGTLIEIRP